MSHEDIHSHANYADYSRNHDNDSNTRSELARGLAEHGAAFETYVTYINDPTVENFEESYRGTFDSDEAFAEQLADDLDLFGNVPETLAQYFDYAAFGRDLIWGGDYWTADGHYFENR